MKLNINKACDLSSISVLPPHSRRSNPISSCVDSSGYGKIQRSQLRSQSQQPFSQGTSLSQLSQGSLDDVLTSEQRFGSQERENSAKRHSCLAPITGSRDESQMHLSRSSNNVMWRMNSTSAPDQRCHVSEELENRIALVESSLNRLVRILDTIQNDVMQVNKAVKEVLMEMEGLRQKIIIQDNHMQLMLKEEEDIKANLSGILKSTLDQLRKESESADQKRLHIISAAISSLPARIEARLLKLHNEICGTFTKKPECSSEWSKQVPVQKAKAKLHKPESLPFSTVKQNMKPKQEEIILTGQDLHKRHIIDTGHEVVGLYHLSGPSACLGVASPLDIHRPLGHPSLVNDFCLIIESDEEIQGGFSRFLEKKETGRKSCLSEEARVESMRILKKARRKRKLDSAVVLD